MTVYHVNSKGEAGACSAKEGNCPFGNAEKHYLSKEAARAAYENEHKSFSKIGVNTLGFERGEFFDAANAGNFAVIEKSTGYVLSDNLVLVEAPTDSDELEDFYETPSDFLYDAVAIQEASSYHFTKNTLVVEPETDALVSPRDLYAIDTSKHEVDFEAILEDESEASRAVDEFGFKLWD